MIADAIRIVLTDDHSLFRTALRSLLRLIPRVEVVAEAEDGLAAVDVVEQLKPDCVLMDLNMPKLDGIGATRIITSKHPCTKVIVLTMHTDPEFKREAAAAGACLFLEKGCGKDAIEKAISDCVEGKTSTECAGPGVDQVFR